jgi:hypothetical protein
VVYVEKRTRSKHRLEGDVRSLENVAEATLATVKGNAVDADERRLEKNIINKVRELER